MWKDKQMNNNGMPELVSPPYTYSLKLEETARGIRISVYY
jgi:hypothetical protein